MNKFRSILLAAPFLCSLCFAAPERADKKEEAPPRRAMTERGENDPIGKIEQYVSKMDGETRPYAICATDDLKDPKPLILQVNPGGNGLEGSVRMCEQYAAILKRNGKSAIVLRPTGRGNGTLYENYGEVDLFEAVEDAAAKYVIDRDRISVFGHSMGGAATWYLISHYPDYFSAAAPMSGYCDHRLWAKPGGYTFPMADWEEASWKARSAAFLVENLEHTPVWILHGEWDRGMGSGVSVEHARGMKRLMTDKGFPPEKYSEFPKKAHHFIEPGTETVQEEILLWLISKKKQRTPEHVALATYDLRHNRSYWVTIEQMMEYGGKRAFAEAALSSSNALSVKTENIRTLALGPIAGRKGIVISIDSSNLGKIDLRQKVTFRRNEAGVWKAGKFNLRGEKRHGCSGPIGDLFFAKTIFVYGSKGKDEENYFSSWVANNARQYYKEFNGGVHRGGIHGDNDVNLPMVKDTDLTAEEMRSSNLVLFGTYRTNSVLARFEGKLPLEFKSGSIRLGGKDFAGDKAAVIAVFPHPENRERYIAVQGGIAPDATTFSSHFNLGLLPDYLVYDGAKTLGWGFWKNGWAGR